ncbi:hypothetical protein ACH7WW_001400 [Vibrio vulnificus]|uniref:hypothetical protein n=1 Tax=Vibrio vulnificus TaxID=672 RepID=UPI00102BF330|nr:hypothetical protein [Vibrio vulnificus]MCU8387039.1 hypothetical protein [Vibrio vulnificus]RZR32005.1 hypothetical protein D8T61_08585 [Vibrio vulnificus]
MTWITLPSVSVQNGSKIVTVNNTQTTNIKVGDALLIGNYQPVEIAGVFATQLSLRTNWSNAAQANASAVVMPTFGDFNAATQALRQATQVTQGNFKTLEDWGTKLGNITFEGQDNSKHNARTLLQMDADVIELEEQANNLIVSLSGLNFALSKAIVDVLRSRNKEQYVASGFIHTGRAAVPNAAQNVINEGMWQYTGVGSENRLYLGRNAAVSSVGTSDTPHPVMNIAGFTVHLRNINNTDPHQSTVKFQESPNGAVVSDSSGNCRGSGKPTLDLSKEVDPKYGDVAADVNEAVARAFEGIVRNGDNRNGLMSWVGTGSIANDEMVLGSAEYLWQYTGGYYDISSSKDYVVEVVAADVVGTAEIIIYADTNKAASRRLSNGINVFTVTEFTQNFGGTTDYVRLSTASGSAAKILRVSVREVTEEVVTDRVDMAGLEFFKEKVGAYLYPYGMIQNKATADDGVATTEDTVRPITYFAVFDGDTTSRGLGWKLADLTFVQLATIMSNPEHNAWYNEAGELMQFRCRQRSFAGLGNGDWRVINPKGDILSFGTENLTRVAAQGRLDTPASPSGGGNFFAGYTFTAHNRKPEVGMFTLSANSGDYQAPDGECYFYVLATVPRLNQGAYHQSLNPMGTKHWNRHDASGGNFWHQPNTGNNKTTARAFYQTIVVGETGARQPTGAIGQNSGRGDGRFYDAIYASGQGGVIDWRLPARDMSSKEEAAKIFQKVVNGSYRGLEKLKQSIVTVGANADSAVTEYQAIGTLAEYGHLVGKRVTKLCGVIGGVVWEHSRFLNNTVYESGGLLYVRLNGQQQRAPSMHYVLETETNLSVSGDFTQAGVVGSPVEIMKVEALKNGWVGSWYGLSKSGGVAVTASRKNTLTSPLINGVVVSSDQGSTWSTGSTQASNVLNIVTATYAVTEVRIVNHTAFAKQTKPSSNKLVLNGSEGLGDVWNSADSRIDGGVLLAESMLEKVFTNSLWTASQNVIRLASFKLANDRLSLSGNLNKHDPLILSEPENNSPAVKALWHQASNNRQATLNFLWNELVFDAAWRTPDKVWSGGSVAVAAGETFRAESSSAYAVAGLLMRCVKAVTANATVLGAMHVTRTGEVISITDGLTYFKVVTDGWSDDAIIRIIDGVGTFNNENGDTCLYGISELAMPYGYTKNQAGAGKQVVGVDL